MPHPKALEGKFIRPPLLTVVLIAIQAALSVPRQFSMPPPLLVIVPLPEGWSPSCSIVLETENADEFCSDASLTLTVPAEKVTGAVMASKSIPPPGPSPTSMVAPDIERLPARPMVGPPSIVKTPLAKARVAPEATVKAPRSVPPPASAMVPALTLTVPPLLLSSGGEIVVVPGPVVLVMVPLFSMRAPAERLMLPLLAVRLNALLLVILPLADIVSGLTVVPA